MATFLTYMVGISKMKEIHRVFEYHGAEHKMCIRDRISPKYADRNGGYTRIIKIGARRGDAAEMAVLELV